MSTTRNRRLPQLGTGATDPSPLHYSVTLYSASLSSANGQCSNFTGNGYAPDGNVITSHDPVNGNWTYSYDDMNRLVSAKATSGPQNGNTWGLTYEGFGNRWSQSENGSPVQSLRFTQGNHHINGSIYDASGNLLSDGLNSYTYDDENRISAVTLGSGGTLQYSYDAEGQRIRKQNGSTVDEYVFDPAGHRSAI